MIKTDSEVWKIIYLVIGFISVIAYELVNNSKMLNTAK
jgi:hypothetical protein